MTRRKISVFVFLGLIILIVVGVPSSFAQTETITITTYYPSPFGIYNELRAKKMAIGASYYNPAGTSINDPADLIVEGNVGIGTTSPHSVPPNGNTGNLDVNDIYLRATGNWMSQGVGLLNCEVHTCSYGGGSGCTVHCPAGYVATGGGSDVPSISGGGDEYDWIYYHPVPNTDGSVPTGYYCNGRNVNNGTCYAVCCR